MDGKLTWQTFKQIIQKKCAFRVLFSPSMLSATGRAYIMLRQNEWCYSACATFHMDLWREFCLSEPHCCPLQLLVLANFSRCQSSISQHRLCTASASKNCSQTSCFQLGRFRAWKMDEKRSGKSKGGDSSSKSTGSYLDTVSVHVENLNFAKYLLSVNVDNGKMICKMLPCWSSLVSIGPSFRLGFLHHCDKSRTFF